MEARAVVKYIGISPKKARLVVDSVRGKRVDDALAVLMLYTTPVARSVAKVIKSAASNAENNFQISFSEMKISKIFVDSGPTIKRSIPQARGRVNPILRHTSHITVVVEEE